MSGFENEEHIAPPPEAQTEQPEGTARSLDAVFSRLNQPGRGYRDNRQRASGGSGLGPVFRRLR